MCKKAAKQINVLRRLSSLLSPISKLKIFNSFINSNFNYCPIVYNTFTKQSSRIKEKLYERALRFVFNDFDSPYDSILCKSEKDSLTLSKLKNIAEQVYKIRANAAPPISPDFFLENDSRYNMRSVKLSLPKYNTVKYGKHSFRYMGAIIWNALPNDIKFAADLKEFKTKLKIWKGSYCM